MISLRKWSDRDRAVLDLTVGDPAMMAYLGPHEDSAALDARHLRYLASNGWARGAMYVIVAGPQNTIVGSTGFWEISWLGEAVYECGWMTFTEHAGRGYASEAAREIVALARAAGGPSSLHAFPAVENIASNEVCRKAGFANTGPCEGEYPRGRKIIVHDWRFDLHTPL